MLIRIHPDNPDPRQIKEAVNCLKNGGVIIYPTDTVYAIGCDVYNKKAMEKLCRIKGIDIKKHKLSFVCYDLSHIADFTKQLSTSTYKLMKKTLPGPYTFILEANNAIPKLFKNSKKEIGIMQKLYTFYFSFNLLINLIWFAKKLAINSNNSTCSVLC